MCLATAPQVLLLDEPLAGMGAEETERMLTLLAELRADHAILLVEHDMDAVFRLADRITTVSPTYAAEIRTQEGGMGLDGLLRSLREAPKAVRGRVVQAGMRKGGNVIRDEARRRAPKASGFMASQIVTRRANARNRARAGVGQGGEYFTVGVKTGRRRKYANTKRNRRRGRVVPHHLRQLRRRKGLQLHHQPALGEHQLVAFGDLLRQPVRPAELALHEGGDLKPARRQMDLRRHVGIARDAAFARLVGEA